MSWGFTTQILVFYEIFFCNSAHSSVIFLSKQNGHLHFPQLVIRKGGGVSWNVLFKWTSLILLDVKSDRDRFESVQSSRPSQKSVSGFVGLRAFAEVNHTISRCDLHVEAIEGGTDDNTWNLWVPVYFLDLTLTMMSK